MQKIKLFMKFLDYIFYRLTKLYFKYDGKEASTSLVILTFIQAAYALSLAMFFFISFFDKNEIKKNIDVLSLFYLISFVFFTIYNRIKYKNKYDLFNEKWKDQTNTEKLLGGWLVFMTILFSIVSIIVPTFFNK